DKPYDVILNAIDDVVEDVENNLNNKASKQYYNSIEKDDRKVYKDYFNVVIDNDDVFPDMENIRLINNLHRVVTEFKTYRTKECVTQWIRDRVAASLELHLHSKEEKKFAAHEVIDMK